jgi:hypothetical protein
MSCGLVGVALFAVQRQFDSAQSRFVGLPDQVQIGLQIHGTRDLDGQRHLLQLPDCSGGAISHASLVITRKIQAAAFQSLVVETPKSRGRFRRMVVRRGKPSTEKRPLEFQARSDRIDPLVDIVQVGFARIIFQQFVDVDRENQLVARLKFVNSSTSSELPSSTVCRTDAEGSLVWKLTRVKGNEPSAPNLRARYRRSCLRGSVHTEIYRRRSPHASVRCPGRRLER